VKRIKVAFFVILVCGLNAASAQQAASIFYKFDVVAKNGQTTGAGTFSGFGSGPSVSEMGMVAFVGQLSSAGDSIFMGNGSATPIWVTAGFVNSSTTFDNSVQINRTNQILGNDRASGAPTLYFDRIWDGNNPGNFTPVAEGCGSSCQFSSVFSNAALNNLNQAAISGFDDKGNILLITPNGTSFNTQTVNGVSLRPMMDDAGEIVIYDSTKKQISLYSNNLASVTDIADATNLTSDFTSLGQSPGISRNGSVIAFFGNINKTGAGKWKTTAGPGIFVSASLGAGARQILRIAGNQTLPELGYDATGNKITFSSAGFNSSLRVGVADLDLGAAGIANDSFIVSFIGTPTAASRDNPAYPGHPLFFSDQQGIWTTRVDVENELNSPFGIVFHPRGAIRVAQIGDLVQGLTISQISVFDPIALAGADDAGALRTMRRGDHYVAFWAADTSNNQMILRGSHLDSDQDGLLDHWETDGIDIDGDGTPELDLKAMGADPKARDVFLEIDWLADQTDHVHTPANGVVVNFVNNLANSHVLSGAMYGARLDGSAPDDIPAGINVHVDAGPGKDAGKNFLSINMGTGLLQGGDQIGMPGQPRQNIDVVYFGIPCPLHAIFIVNSGKCSAAIPGLTTRAFSDIKDNVFGTADKRAREFAFHYAVFADSHSAVLDSSNNPFVSKVIQPVSNNSLTSATALPPPPGGDTDFGGYVLKITTGTGAGQVRKITDNAQNTIQVSPNWSTNPDTTSSFILLHASSGIGEELLSKNTTDSNSLGGNDLVLTMRGFGIGAHHLLATPCEQWRSLTHEFGHNMGLHHCGTVDDQNVCKNSPLSYLSVMSYAWQSQCVPLEGPGYSTTGNNNLFDDSANFNLVFSDVNTTMGNTSIGFLGSNGVVPQDQEPGLQNYNALNGPIDLFPPSVTITSPAPLSVVLQGNNLTVTFNGVDNVAVASAAASFDVAGTGQPQQVVATSTGGSAYQAVFTGISGPNAYRTLQASALDPSGNIGFSQIPIQVGSGTPGAPALSAQILDQGLPSSGVMYVDLQLTDTGSSDADKILINRFVFNTLVGTGAVTYNTTESPKLPISENDLDVGASNKIRLYFNVPSTVTSFSVNEQGTFQNAAKVGFNYSVTETVNP